MPSTLKSIAYCATKDYCDRVVKETFAEDEAIEEGVHVEVGEDGKCGDRVCGRDDRAEIERVKEGDLEHRQRIPKQFIPSPRFGYL